MQGRMPAPAAAAAQHWTPTYRRVPAPQAAAASVLLRPGKDCICIQASRPAASAAAEQLLAGPRRCRSWVCATAQRVYGELQQQ